MGIEYYLFALFVFGLVSLLIVMFLKGMKKNRLKDEQELDEQEEKIMMLYFEVEDMIDALKEYVNDSKKSIEADIQRIETDMNALSTLRNGLEAISLEKKQNSVTESEATSTQEMDSTSVEEKPTNSNEAVGDIIDISVGKKSKQPPASPNETIHALVERGEDLDTIAKAMDISKTEVALMLKINSYSNQ